MIYIQKNSVTTFALELSQTLPSSYEYFLFEFEFEATLFPDSKWLITPDISHATNRYNLFQISESDFGNLIYADNYSASPYDALKLDIGQHSVFIYASDSPWIIFGSPVIFPTRDQAVQQVRGVVHGPNDPSIDPVYLGLQDPEANESVYD
jgi:hypothetical protein